MDEAVFKQEEFEAWLEEWANDANTMEGQSYECCRILEDGRIFIAVDKSDESIKCNVLPAIVNFFFENNLDFNEVCLVSTEEPATEESLTWDEMQFILEDGRVCEVRFEGDGVVSDEVASISATDYIKSAWPQGETIKSSMPYLEPTAPRLTNPTQPTVLKPGLMEMSEKTRGAVSPGSVTRIS